MTNPRVVVAASTRILSMSAFTVDERVPADVSGTWRARVQMPGRTVGVSCLLTPQGAWRSGNPRAALEGTAGVRRQRRLTPGAIAEALMRGPC